MELTKLDPEVISYKTLRLYIGLLGLALPPALIIGTSIFGCDHVLESMSHYYYSKAGDIFIGIIFSFAILLISYRGYIHESKTDSIVSTIGGIAAIIFVLIPTTNISDSGPLGNCEIFRLGKGRELQCTIHYISAGTFLLCMAIMSFFQFPSWPGDRSKWTSKRWLHYWIYRVCGIIIALSVIGAFICFKSRSDIIGIPGVFFFEWVAVYAFAIPWLIKSEIGILSPR